jgi:hypothetical protein
VLIILLLFLLSLASSIDVWIDVDANVIGIETGGASIGDTSDGDDDVVGTTFRTVHRIYSKNKGVTVLLMLLGVVLVIMVDVVATVNGGGDDRNND